MKAGAAAFVPYKPKLLNLAEVDDLEAVGFKVPVGFDQTENLDLYDDLTERGAGGGRDVSGGLLGGVFVSIL